jgi:hypothetical protein
VRIDHVAVVVMDWRRICPHDSCSVRFGGGRSNTVYIGPSQTCGDQMTALLFLIAGIVVGYKGKDVIAKYWQLALDKFTPKA